MKERKTSMYTAQEERNSDTWKNESEKKRAFCDGTRKPKDPPQNTTNKSGKKGLARRSKGSNYRDANRNARKLQWPCPMSFLRSLKVWFLLFLPVVFRERKETIKATRDIPEAQCDITEYPHANFVRVSSKTKKVLSHKTAWNWRICRLASSGRANGGKTLPKQRCGWP